MEQLKRITFLQSYLDFSYVSQKSQNKESFSLVFLMFLLVPWNSHWYICVHSKLIWRTNLVVIWWSIGLLNARELVEYATDLVTKLLFHGLLNVRASRTCYRPHYQAIPHSSIGTTCIVVEEDRGLHCSTTCQSDWSILKITEWQTKWPSSFLKSR